MSEEINTAVYDQEAASLCGDNHDPSLVRFARKCIDYARPKWVSVTERMPTEVLRPVLVLDKNGNVYLGNHWYEYWTIDSGPYVDAVCISDIDRHFTITHWMPLPEGPKPPCAHERLNEDGICRGCGEDRRGI